MSSTPRQCKAWFTVSRDATGDRKVREGDPVCSCGSEVTSLHLCIIHSPRTHASATCCEPAGSDVAGAAMSSPSQLPELTLCGGSQPIPEHGGKQ